MVASEMMNKTVQATYTLARQNIEGTEYNGFLEVNNESFQVQISLPSSRKMAEADVMFDWCLANLLQDKIDILKQRLCQSEHVDSFMLELGNLVNNSMRNCKNYQSLNMENCSNIVKELEQLGYEHITFVSETLDEIHVKVEDEGNREHVINIFVIRDYPNVSPKISVDLPSEHLLTWNKNCRLIDVIQQFKTWLTDYQVLWNMLDEIDNRTCLFEAEHLSRSSCSRRISLGENISLQVTLDPKHPTSIPQFQFLGPEHSISKILETLTSNLERWGEDRTVLTNLEELCEMVFENRKDVEKEERPRECGICYSYNLDGCLPDICCHDERCACIYHQTCLYEWMRALPSTRISFNTLFGECVYCGKSIKVKMPSG